MSLEIDGYVSLFLTTIYFPVVVNRVDELIKMRA